MLTAMFLVETEYIKYGIKEGKVKYCMILFADCEKSYIFVELLQTSDAGLLSSGGT